MFASSVRLHRNLPGPSADYSTTAPRIGRLGYSKRVMTRAVDESFMRLALERARAALQCGEVPVGAVAVADGKALVAGHNRTVTRNDPTGHAEMVCLREAASRLGNHRLTGVALYVTLEPCTMCYGALVHARVERLVFGASDPKSGALGGATDVRELGVFNHRIDVVGGVLADESADMLRAFFRKRR